MRVSELLKMGETHLLKVGIANAKGEAEQIFCGMKNYDRSKFFLRWSQEATDNEIESFMLLIEKRATRMPIQQVLGSTEFMGYPFKVREEVLIPRMDTEVLVMEALKVITKKDHVLDLCTGSGIIGISIAKECEANKLPVKITLSDLSDHALDLAKENMELNGIKLDLVKSDLFDKFKKKKFNVIVSNPPYIPKDVIPTLDIEVREYDPIMALDGGEDGLNFYRQITAVAGEYLKKKGYLLYEIGHDQGADVSEMLTSAGFEDVKVIKDLAGHDRVVMGTFVGKK